MRSSPPCQTSAFARYHCAKGGHDCGLSLVIVVRPIHNAQVAVWDARMKGVRVLHGDCGVGAAMNGEYSAALDRAAVRVHVQGDAVVHVLQPS